MEKISIYPDKELKKRLEEIAEKQHRSLNNLILLMLRQLVNSKKPLGEV